jgi:hypothetical protein
MRTLVSVIAVLVLLTGLYLAKESFNIRVCESLVKEYEVKIENVLVDFDNRCVPLRVNGSSEYGQCVLSIMTELNKLEQEIGLKVHENDCQRYIGKMR